MKLAPTGRRSRTHEDQQSMSRRTDLQSILIVGSGRIVIGQADEFDYSGKQAVRVLPEKAAAWCWLTASRDDTFAALRSLVTEPVRNDVELAPGSPSLDDRPQMSSKRKMRRRSQAAAQALEIVYGPMDLSWHSRLSPETREAMPGLHALLHDDPRAAVTELRAWIEREPLPMFFNWLSGAYSALGDVPSVEDTVRENYRRNPQYLFARVNYAELCLRDGDLDGALEALGGGLDIRALLGGRKRVHVSELTAYFYAVGLYHIKAGDPAAAEHVYGILKNVAPDEPPTEELRRRLHPRLRDLLVTWRRRR
ncbi:hypothetical protein [Longimicrobium sp.]|uniref:tetratricopeptide repeat protein n=1 Tax=Longimicrobium sp. TaxID=2029185 RepID=UPI002ED7F7A7